MRTRKIKTTFNVLNSENGTKHSDLHLGQVEEYNVTVFTSTLAGGHHVMNCNI